MLTIQANYDGANEWERLQVWASSVQPGDYPSVGVKGFGLSGFQYMRMLFGVQTTKPDVHVIRFVSEAVGRSVTDVQALFLLEQAAKAANLPLREVDGAIWEAGAHPPRTAAPSVQVPVVDSHPRISPPPSPRQVPWWAFWRRRE